MIWVKKDTDHPLWGMARSVQGKGLLIGVVIFAGQTGVHEGRSQTAVTQRGWLWQQLQRLTLNSGDVESFNDYALFSTTFGPKVPKANFDDCFRLYVRHSIHNAQLLGWVDSRPLVKSYIESVR
jgi:hypothetical protein